MPKYKYEELKTVDDLMAELQAIKEKHGNVPFGVVGHFGEIYSFSFNDGYFHSGKSYQVPINTSWRCDQRKEMPVYNVSVINLGEEPD